MLLFMAFVISLFDKAAKFTTIMKTATLEYPIRDYLHTFVQEDHHEKRSLRLHCRKWSSVWDM